MIRLFRLVAILAICLSLGACAAKSPIVMTSDLAQGKRYFETGYYKKAMRILLPLAVEENGQAQYAVGYMWYYGYGVPQDTDTGYFWISRSAAKGYKPASEALALIDAKKSTQF